MGRGPDSAGSHRAGLRVLGNVQEFVFSEVENKKKKGRKQKEEKRKRDRTTGGKNNEVALGTAVLVLGRRPNGKTRGAGAGEGTRKGVHGRKRISSIAVRGKCPCLCREWLWEGSEESLMSGLSKGGTSGSGGACVASAPRIGAVRVTRDGLAARLTEARDRPARQGEACGPAGSWLSPGASRSARLPPALYLVGVRGGAGTAPGCQSVWKYLGSDPAVRPNTRVPVFRQDRRLSESVGSP